jgi:hypothetical protein
MEGKKMLQDSNGNVSSMRIAFLAVTITACVVAVIGVIRGGDGVGLAALVGALLTPSFGGKAWQSRNGG